MNVGLVNCDARYNLALEKLYRYYIERGDNVHYYDCNFNYYKDNEICYIWAYDLDKVYVSAIFDNSLPKLKVIGDKGQVDYGGVGTPDVSKKLPYEIDQLEPYHIGDIYYNFITRGCIRHCPFCKVWDKEGYIRLNKHPKDMLLSKDNHFLDNNILAYQDHIGILKWLNDNNVKYHFNQGLDFRLVNDANLKLLSESRYSNNYIFAYDDIAYKDKIEKTIPFIKDYIPEPFKTKWYCYINGNDNPDSLTFRVKYLKSVECLPYVMRDKNAYSNSDVHNYFKDVTAYCNQPALFKKKSFSQFLDMRVKDEERIVKDMEYWDKVII